MKSFKNFLIIDDNPFDIGHLRAVLHMICGYDVEIREATTAGDAIEAVKARSPEVVFTDHLSPTDTAISTLLKLRDIGYDGPIVVVTGLADRFTHRELLSAGASDIVIKDDLDSSRLAETLSKLAGKGG
jgi:DNA-binding NarL/FixJ family response regulator